MTPTASTDWPYLTGRERIAYLIREGCSDAEIARYVGGMVWEIRRVREESGIRYGAKARLWDELRVAHV